MIVKAALAAAQPEAERIADLIERDLADKGVAVTLARTASSDWAVEAYLPGTEPEAAATTLRDMLGGDAFGLPLEAAALEEADWVAVGLAQLGPVRAGRFVVHGSHDRGCVPPGLIAIEIDAAQAFGTGHHGTTAGCLLALDRLTRARCFDNPLDVGTGSGVLAIALAKLLRRPVLASDIDSVAVRTARGNARLNRVAPLVKIIEATGLAHPSIQARAPFDLIVANILARPLMVLAPTITHALQSGGTLVLSGLLPWQRERVVAAYRAQGVRLVSAWITDGWGVLVLGRGRKGATVRQRL